MAITTTKRKIKKGYREGHIYFDYKDTDVLGKYLNAQGRILPRRKTALNMSSQRRLALAIKRARFMGLLPYIAS